MERIPVTFPTFSSWLFVVIFLVLIFGPLAFFFMGVGSEIAQTEKRIKAPFPDFALQKVLQATYQKELDRFLNDRFGFRDSLVTWNAYAHVKLLQTSPVPTVVVGKDDWLYYSGENALDDYIEDRPLTEHELENVAQNVRNVATALEKKGKTFVLMMIPEKHTVYPEYLPASHQKRASKTRFQQISSFLQAKRAPFIDVTSALQEAKKIRQIYHRTDTHWNDYGSYVGYRELMSYLNKRYPDVAPRSVEDYVFETREKTNGDLAYLLSLSGKLSETEAFMKRTTSTRTRTLTSPQASPYTEMMIRENPNSKLRLVFFRDSFGAMLVPNIPDHFSRSVFVRSNQMLPELITSENPDVVVLEMVERYEEMLLTLSAEGLE